MSIGLSLVVLVMLPISGSAQDFMFGGRAGAGIAVAMFEDEHSNDRVEEPFAMQFGLVALHQMTRVFSLRVEALYAQKGWAEFVTGGGRRLSYVELPLLLGFHIPWKTSPHVFVGPAVSFEIGCAITEVPDVGSVSCNDSQVEWDRAKLLVGSVVGIGLSPPLGRGALHIELIANFGLTNANREILPRGYLKLAAAGLSLGYTVPIGGN